MIYKGDSALIYDMSETLYLHIESPALPGFQLCAQ